jgi:hypothetical protein
MVQPLAEQIHLSGQRLAVPVVLRDDDALGGHFSGTRRERLREITVPQDDAEVPRKIIERSATARIVSTAPLWRERAAFGQGAQGFLDFAHRRGQAPVKWLLRRGQAELWRPRARQARVHGHEARNHGDVRGAPSLDPLEQLRSRAADINVNVGTSPRCSLRKRSVQPPARADAQIQAVRRWSWPRSRAPPRNAAALGFFNDFSHNKKWREMKLADDFQFIVTPARAA